jgi:hypothetical protein
MRGVRTSMRRVRINMRGVFISRAAVLNNMRGVFDGLPRMFNNRPGPREDPKRGRRDFRVGQDVRSV